MESRYDTFKEDAQYLSAGFERQIRELTAQRTAFTRWAQEARLEPGLTPGALVRLRAEMDERGRSVARKPRAC